MRKKIVFLLSMVLGQCFVFGGGKLETLKGVFEWWQAKPEGWDIAFNCTKDFVEKIAADESFRCFGENLKAIAVFVNSIPCLKIFLDSDLFAQNAQVYDSWLKNLYHVAYNTALKINPAVCFKFKGAFNGLLNDQSQSIRDLCENVEFQRYLIVLEKVLMSSIKWRD